MWMEEYLGPTACREDQKSTALTCIPSATPHTLVEDLTIQTFSWGHRREQDQRGSPDVRPIVTQALTLGSSEWRRPWDGVRTPYRGPGELGKSFLGKEEQLRGSLQPAGRSVQLHEQRPESGGPASKPSGGIIGGGFCAPSSLSVVSNKISKSFQSLLPSFRSHHHLP